MFDIGDGLIIEGYKVPWLIWIQLIVMLLLLFLFLLLCGFSLFSSDLPTATADTSSISPSLLVPISSRSNKAEENQSAGTSRGIRIEEIQEKERPEEKESTLLRNVGHSHHPCHLFGLAKQAILKCLGLDSSTERSSDRRHDKED